MQNKWVVPLVMGVCLLAACSSKNVISTPQLSVKVLETIPQTSAPEWVNSTTEFWEAKGYYYYRGTAEGYTNLEAAKRAGAASARTNMAEQVKSTIRSEFARALESGNYDDTTGGYLKDVFFSAVDNLSVSGIVIQESYLQHLLETTGLQERMYYRAYVLARISVKDYNSVVHRAFSDTKAQTQANKSAKELVKETEARFWAEQNKNEE